MFSEYFVVKETYISTMLTDIKPVQA